MLSTKFFNIRLYLEGLKRLKVIGMATAILSWTISALVPITRWMSTPASKENVDWIEQNALCAPLFFIIFIAPFFFTVLFSFLHKRKESDFFHAIPYTRTCVYVSFASAALTFVFVIMIISAAISGVIWTLNPYTTFSLGQLITFTLMCMLAAAQLCAVMMLALTLTGTPTTTMLMYVLFMLFTRLIMLYFSVCLENNVQIIKPSELPFFNFSWLLPFALFEFAINGADYISVNPFTTPSLVIYTLVTTALLFVAAWLFYKIRKSEMAGNTAPNSVMQHVFRILFTLPLALLVPMFLMTDGAEITGLLVFTVITLLVYYLYELITTKRFKGFGKATLLLPVIVVCCLAFWGAYTCIEHGIYSNTPDDPDDVVSISFDATSSSWDDYQAYLVTDTLSYDRELIEIVMKHMNQTVECDRHDDFSKYYADYSHNAKDDYDYIYYDMRWMKIEFQLANGQTITRRVAFRENMQNKVRFLYANTIQVDPEILWALPKLNEISYISTEYYAGKDEYEYVESIHFDSEDSEINNFYKILAKEYNALSNEQKEVIRRGDAYSYHTSCHSVNIQGRVYGEKRGYFYISLVVSKDLMPESYAYLQNYKKTSS